MYTAMLYQEGVAQVITKEDNLSISYVRCSPPTRLVPKGTILLLHGFLQTSYQFRNVIDLFAFAGYNVITPNLVPCCRQSGARRRSWQTKSGLSHMLAGLLDKLEIQEPVHLVGHDMSANIVLNFAFRYPHRTASIVWGNASPLSTEISKETRTALDLLADIVDQPEFSPVTEQDLRIVLKGYFRNCSSSSNNFSEHDITEYAEELSKTSNLDTMLSLYHATRHNSVTLHKMLQTRGPSHVPSLLLNGARASTATVAGSAQRKLFADSPASKSVKMEDAAYFLAEEQPESYALRVLSFINGVRKQLDRIPEQEYSSSLESANLVPRL